MKILTKTKVSSYLIEKENLNENPFDLTLKISGNQLNLINTKFLKGTKLETGNLQVKDFPAIVKEFQPGLDKLSKKYLKALEKLQDDFSKEVEIYCDKIEDSINFLR